MKTKRIFALVLTLAMLLCAVAIPVNAKDTDVAEDHIEIFIENENLPEDVKARIYAFYLNGGEEEDNVATYGILCNLLGHKLEGTNIRSVLHKARATAPRCLEKTYYYEFCTRCDEYESSTLIDSAYIFCCD